MHQSQREQDQQRAGQLRDELRREVTAEVHADLRKHARKKALLKFFGCAFLAFAVMVAIPLSLGAFLARTGIVEVPFLSAHIAHVTAPERVVMPTPLLHLEQRLAAAARTAAMDGGAMSVMFSEGEVTGLLRSALATASPSVAASVQVAFDSGVVEVFAYIPGVQGATTARVRGTATIANQHLAADPLELVVGRWHAPRFVARFVVARLLAQLPPLLVPASGARPDIAVDGVTLASGYAKITLHPQVPAKGP